MKNLRLYLSCILLTVMIAISSFGVKAADSYTYKVIDQSTKFTGKRTITVSHYSKYVVLKGESKNVKAFNKKAEKTAKKSLKNDIIKIAKESTKDGSFEDDTYYDYGEQRVSYISNNIVSIKNDWFWYGGGVGNTFESGTTYNLNTGKYLKLTDVTKEKSPDKIKSILKKKIEADPDGYDATELDQKDVSKLDFYINKKGNVVVCFGPYELGFGGWTKKYTIKGDVK